MPWKSSSSSTDQHDLISCKEFLRTRRDTRDQEYLHFTMPASFEFLVFSDLLGMHDAKVKTLIRKHAMKDIGASRRRPSRQSDKVALKIRHTIASADDPTDIPQQYSNHQPLILDDQALYNPHTRALSCQPDPFASASIPIDNVAHGLLQYFRHYSTHFPNNFTFTPDVAGVLNSAVRDELTMNCILSAAASRLHYMQGTWPAYLAEAAFSSTQQSLRLLQIRLQSDVLATTSSVEPLVDCILYLAAAALYRGDETSAGVHAAAAVRVIGLSGGLQVLEDPRVVIRMLGLDDVLACRRLRPCNFACTSYEPGPLLPPMEDNLRLDPQMIGSASGVRLLMIDTPLPKGLRDLIPQIVECDALKDASGSTRDGMSSHELMISHSQRLRALAVRNRLLAFSGTDLKARAFRAVLIIWTLLPPNDPRQTENAGVVARDLMRTLGDGSSEDWESIEDVLLWCLIVGAFGGFIGGGSGHGWFVERIHEVLQSKGEQLGFGLGPGLLENLMRLQRRFLHRDAVTGLLTLRLVELLDSRSRADGRSVFCNNVQYR
jgi:hypothetical protein